jgi:hypothetical protein
LWKNPYTEHFGLALTGRHCILVTICNMKAFENLREEIMGLHTQECAVIKLT